MVFAGLSSIALICDLLFFSCPVQHTFKCTARGKSASRFLVTGAIFFLIKLLTNEMACGNFPVFFPITNGTIVNLGAGYETLGISKAGTIQSQLDVEPTVTLHNLLFLVRKLISNKLVEPFDWLSCPKKRVFVGFCAGSRPKKRTKT